MGLIEREEALATLARLCDEAAAGHGGAVVVAGPAAVGKTALLDRAAARAVAAGALVLTATASAAEHGLAMAVLAQFLLGAQVPQDARSRLADLMSAGGPAPEAVPGEPLSALDVRLAERLRAELVGLAEQRPVVIVVDDAHHADDASAAYLAYLVRRIRDARITVLLGHRASSRPAGRDLRLDVLRQPHGHDVTLRPLSEAGCAEYAAARLGPGAEQAAAECFALTGGNPLLLQAVVEDFAAADGSEPPAAGEHYAAAVLACVRRSSPIATRAAWAVAVLGAGPVDRLLELDPPSAQAAVRELEAAGLLRRPLQASVRSDRRFGRPGAGRARGPVSARC